MKQAAIKANKPAIPVDVLKYHLAILGKTGSGKTFTAKGLVEYLLSAGERVCVVDPTDVWWGLRSQADGKKAAYPVVVFGGPHADLPLTGNDGAAIAEIIGTKNINAVIVTRSLSVRDRTKFFTDFAEMLLQVNAGGLHLVIDEAHIFAPQGKVNDPQSGKMVHAANNLVSLGRGIGLRIMLISQRAAKLHKDSLTQVETLIAMRLIAPQDRQAVRDWISEWADAETGKEILSSLPSMATGTGWVWSPEQDFLKKIKFPLIKTYDSSKAPSGKSRKVVLADIELPEIKERLAAYEQKTADENPKLLRKRIAELEKLVAKPAPVQVPQYTEKQLEDMQQKAFKKGFDVCMRIAQEQFASVLGSAERADKMLRVAAGSPFKIDTVKPVRERSRVAVSKPEKLSDYTGKVIDGAAILKEKGIPSYSNPSPKMNPGSDGEKLSPAFTKMLTALAQYPQGRSKKQMGLLTGYSASSGSFSTYLSGLRSRGWIEGGGDNIKITQAGLDALGEYEPLPTGQALREFWFSKLGNGGARKILEQLCSVYPDAQSKEDIGAAIGMSATSGSFSTYRSKLNTLELIESVNGELRASEDLF